jgi:hypothetical protein
MERVGGTWGGIGVEGGGKGNHEAVGSYTLFAMQIEAKYLLLTESSNTTPAGIWCTQTPLTHTQQTSVGASGITTMATASIGSGRSSQAALRDGNE